MARKLRPDEAEVFNGAMDEAIPTGAEEFLKSLKDNLEDSEEQTLLQEILSYSPQKPLGS